MTGLRMSVYYYEPKHCFCHATAAPVAMVEDLSLAHVGASQKSSSSCPYVAVSPQRSVMFANVPCVAPKP